MMELDTQSVLIGALLIEDKLGTVCSAGVKH